MVRLTHEMVPGNDATVTKAVDAVAAPIASIVVCSVKLAPPDVASVVEPVDTYIMSTRKIPVDLNVSVIVVAVLEIIA